MDVIHYMTILKPDFDIKMFTRMMYFVHKRAEDPLRNIAVHLLNCLLLL